MVGQLCLLLAFSAMTMAAQAQPGLGFGLLGIAEGQTLRVNALNLGNRSSTAATGCEVTLRFLDAKGVVLRESVVQLPAGQGASLDLRRAQVSNQPGRASVRAVLLFGFAGGGAPRGPDVRQNFDCNIVPTLELFDEATGRATVVLTDTTPLPLPDQRSIGFRGDVEPDGSQSAA